MSADVRMSSDYCSLLTTLAQDPIETFLLHIKKAEKTPLF